MPVTVVLADDHQIVRQGLKLLLAAEADLQLVGEASTGLEAIRQTEQFRPTVLVLDLAMPELDGLEVTRRLTRSTSSAHIVILSMHAEESYVSAALQAGACGYVVKDASAANLVQAIRAAAVGRRYLSPPFSEQSLTAYAAHAAAEPLDPLNSLTPREREILQLTAEGHSGREIAQRLFISPRTVETHRVNIMHKLAVRNQRELVRYAVEREVVRRTLW